MAAPGSLREKVEHNALWVSLGAIALAAAVVYVGVQVAPETFYDRFWWEDIYGPLVVDAYQCGTIEDAGCRDIARPAGIPVKDGYTITSELTYGLVLATMLYGIYVGLFRRFQIRADGWFVAGLLPWILLGPLGRVLEDTNVFCQAGTDCTPGGFAYLFISPVIYLHIAVYVIAFLLLGVYIRERAHQSPAKLTAIIAAVLAVGLAAFAFVSTRYAHGFTALPPLWFEILVALVALALFHWRARNGLASVNLTVFVLGLPFAGGCAWLIGRWLSGARWAHSDWRGYEFVAGAFVLAMALLVAALVYAASRRLAGSTVSAAWAHAATRVPAEAEKRIGQTGGIALVSGILLAGILPGLTPLIQRVPMREQLIPALMLGGLLALVVFAFLHVGREQSRHPGALLVFALGINVALVFAHMMDGFATWVATEDPLGFGLNYGGKHPVSEFLGKFGNGFAFPLTKFLMVLVVAWMLDRETREEGKDTLDARNMVGLVKMAIFVLGFAPGLRDVLRLTMGV